MTGSLRDQYGVLICHLGNFKFEALWSMCSYDTMLHRSVSVTHDISTTYGTILSLIILILLLSNNLSNLHYFLPTFLIQDVRRSHLDKSQHLSICYKYKHSHVWTIRTLFVLLQRLVNDINARYAHVLSWEEFHESTERKLSKSIKFFVNSY